MSEGMSKGASGAAPAPAPVPAMTEADARHFRRALWCIRATGAAHVPLGLAICTAFIYQAYQLTTRPDLPPIAYFGDMPKVEPEAYEAVQRALFGFGVVLAVVFWIFGVVIWKLARAVERRSRWAWWSGMGVGFFALFSTWGSGGYWLIFAPFVVMGVMILFGLTRPGVRGNASPEAGR